MARKEKKRVGRKPSVDGREKLTLSVKRYQYEWLQAQKEGPSSLVQRLLDAEIAREKNGADDYDASLTHNQTTGE